MGNVYFSPVIRNEKSIRQKRLAAGLGGQRADSIKQRICPSFMGKLFGFRSGSADLKSGKEHFFDKSSTKLMCMQKKKRKELQAFSE
ncbi:MAG: hypothetical protein HFF18_03880 [Oscillospiraceae bacterium]|nr:hypothetical protein [Oscillospiraceae bacterium]